MKSFPPVKRIWNRPSQEAKTEEEEQAVAEEVEKYDAEKQAHEDAKANLAQEIEGLENDITALEAENPRRLSGTIRNTMKKGR